MKTFPCKGSLAAGGGAAVATESPFAIQSRSTHATIDNWERKENWINAYLRQLGDPHSGEFAGTQGCSRLD